MAHPGRLAAQFYNLEPSGYKPKIIMRIGYDISQTGAHKAGCGYFADSLLLALLEQDHENHYLLYPHFGTTYWDPRARHLNHHNRFAQAEIRPIGKNRDQAFAFWQKLPADAEARLGNPDIVHSFNFSAPRGLQHARLVYTLHDLNFLELPELSTEENRWVCFNGAFDAAVTADFIIANSTFTRQCFLENFPAFPADRIRTVPLGSRFGPDSPQKPPSDSRLESGRFWLTVGTLEPRKNLRRLLQAYAAAPPGTPAAELSLVLTGGRGWLEDDLNIYIRELGIADRVILTGYVSDSELAWLYAHCYAFVYPSLYEGFGMPVLEAMSLGAAVITSRTTSLPEVGGPAARYVDPRSCAEIGSALHSLAGDPGQRERQREKSRQQARKFSWPACAAAVQECYHEVLSRPRRE